MGAWAREGNSYDYMSLHKNTHAGLGKSQCHEQTLSRGRRLATTIQSHFCSLAQLNGQASLALAWSQRIQKLLLMASKAIISHRLLGLGRGVEQAALPGLLVEKVSQGSTP